MFARFDLLQERAICLYGDVFPESAQDIVTGLLKLESDGSRMPILLYINSYGGEVYSAMGIIDVIDKMETPVATISCGAAMSAAALIAASGTPNMRFASPESRFMIHQVSGGAEGTFDSVIKDLDELRIVHKRFLKKLSEKTGQPLEKIEKDVAKNYYLSAEEARNYGLIDHVNLVLPSHVGNHAFIEIRPQKEPASDHKKTTTRKRK